VPGLERHGQAGITVRQTTKGIRFIIERGNVDDDGVRRTYHTWESPGQRVKVTGWLRNVDGRRIADGEEGSLRLYLKRDDDPEECIHNWNYNRQMDDLKVMGEVEVLRDGRLVADIERMTHDADGRRLADYNRGIPL
jgi:hypothetical protein